MEVNYQNKFEDLEAYYDFVITKTEIGKKYSFRVFLRQQIIILTASAIVAYILLLPYSSLKLTILWFLIFFWGCEFLILFVSAYNPRYYFTKNALMREGNKISVKAKVLFELPRKCTIEDEWLDIQYSEAHHRWKWQIIDTIAVTSDFIIINISQNFVILIPKRDFASENDFSDLANRIVDVEKKSKNKNSDGNSILPILTSSETTKNKISQKYQNLFTILLILVGVLLCCLTYTIS